MEDYRMKVRDIAEIVGISVDRLHNILHKKIRNKKALCVLKKLFY